MWDNTEPTDPGVDRHDRAPLPVDTGNPLVAAMSVLAVLGLMAAMFLVSA